MPNQIETLDHVFHALADPTRRAVLQQLSRGDASISELAKPHKMALPSFLQHIQVLEESGLVRSKKVGRVRTCKMEPKALSKAEAWIHRQQAIWEGRLDRMEAYLDDLQGKERRRAKTK